MLCAETRRVLFLTSPGHVVEGTMAGKMTKQPNILTGFHSLTLITELNLHR